MIPATRRPVLAESTSSTVKMSKCLRNNLSALEPTQKKARKQLAPEVYICSVRPGYKLQLQVPVERIFSLAKIRYVRIEPIFCKCPWATKGDVNYDDVIDLYYDGEVPSCMQYEANSFIYNFNPELQLSEEEIREVCIHNKCKPEDLLVDEWYPSGDSVSEAEFFDHMDHWDPVCYIYSAYGHYVISDDDVITFAKATLDYMMRQYGHDVRYVEFDTPEWREEFADVPLKETKEKKSLKDKI